MASLVTGFIAKKILKERVANHFGQEDPYFESVPATRLDGKPTGKVKKRKKAIPPGVSEHDGRVLTKVKRRAWRLDMCLFSICGIRFGWGSAIAIVPAIGDALDALMALMVFRTCCKVEDGLPNAIKIKMFWNIVVDFVIGLIPFVGDIADAAFRCNTKNAVILEQHLREKGEKALRQAGKPIPSDPSDSAAYDRMRRDGLDSDEEVVDRQPQRSDTMNNGASNGRSGRSTQSRTPTGEAPMRSHTTPAKAKTRDSHRSGGGWFSRRNRAADEEMGDPVIDDEPAPSRRQSRRDRRDY